jgi:hypothetical protein
MAISKEIKAFLGIKNPEQEKQLLQGYLITRAIPLKDLPLYQRAGLETGYKILSIAGEGEVFLSSKKSLIMKSGKNGVPHLAAIFKKNELIVPEGGLAVSIERPKSRPDFKHFDSKLTMIRDQTKRKLTYKTY